MSRSYKHTPYSGLKKDRFMKRYANHKLRRKKMIEVLDHNSYRKDTNSWVICDYYTMYSSFEEYYQDEIRAWNHRKSYSWFNEEEDPFPSREKCWRLYHKYYIRK